MIAYHLAIHDKGAETEILGSMACANDAEAIAFGKRTVKDMMTSDAKHCTSWTMDITEGKRAVSSVPLK
jgi:hypothetical protein